MSNQPGNRLDNRPSGPEGPTPDPGDQRGPGEGRPAGGIPRRSPSSTFLLLMIIALIVLVFLWQSDSTKYSEISWGFFWEQLEKEPTNIESVHVKGQMLTGTFKVPPPAPEADKKAETGSHALLVTPKPEQPKEPGAEPVKEEPILLNKDFRTYIPLYVGDNLDAVLREKLGRKYDNSPASDGTGMMLILYLIMSVVFIGIIFFMFKKTRDQMMGGNMLAGFGKSPARRYQTGEGRTTFDDVAALDGVKRELEEIVEYLKNPKKFERLGGRVPKGVLLVGPPGTGKTLLGRAVAGEANVPFFSINGSEFIQMFVGVGASRVRDMFTTAKENAPSILFIDEIDAVGRHRGTGVGGGHDEREQTLNQILSEMDGFLQNETVIVMAATNRPDVLDPALLRPGRFDRHVTVDRPTKRGRKEIFEVHTRGVPLADNVDMERLAAATIGLTGADIRNVVNEAALWASRQDKEKVDMSDFEYAHDKALMGVPREDILSDDEKEMVAYHEAGHTLMAWLVPEQCDRLHKVTIIPRGQSLGMTMLLPDEDRLSMSERRVRCQLLLLLGGRAAEKIRFGEYHAGAADDLKKATELTRRMVTHWGMSERLGPIALPDGESHPFLGREIAAPRRHSEHTAVVIDEEISRILREIFEQAHELLTNHRDKLDKLARKLVEDETLEDGDIEALIGPPAHASGGRDTCAKDAKDNKTA